MHPTAQPGKAGCVFNLADEDEFPALTTPPRRLQKSEIIDIQLSSNYIITCMEFIKIAQIDRQKKVNISITYPGVGIMYDVLGITSVGQIR